VSIRCLKKLTADLVNHGFRR